MTNKERYRVKPGLSLSSKELYRRFKNNSLVNSGEGQYNLDEQVQEYMMMDKLQRLNSLKNTHESIHNLKQQINARSRQS